MRLINRHNYEEFFLLYADAELSVSEKQSVEQFVEANPDLMDEFTLFLNLQLPIDTISFQDKERLLRNESIEMNLNNYEEQFLLYVDNELNSVEKNKVETFVLQHPNIQEKFTLLKQTQLIAESIEFPNKQSLYKKEEKERPVFYMHWTRMAVAAVFMGVFVLVWTLVQNNNSATEQMAKLNPSLVIPQTTGPGSIFNKQENSLSLAENVTNNESVRIKKEVPVKTFTPSSQKDNQLNNIDNTTAFTSQVSSEKKNNSVEIVQTESTVSIQSDNTMALIDRNTTLSNNLIPASINNAESISAANSIELPVVYKELDTEDDKKSLYLGSIEINKDKLRGFFRKAGSIFRSKERQQEDEKSDVLPVTNTQLLK